MRPLRVEARRAPRRCAAWLLVLGLALGLSGCATVPPEPVATSSPSPTVPSAPTIPTVPTAPAASPTPAPTQSSTADPTMAPTTAAPTVSASAKPTAVNATGSMLTYSNLVSDQLAGTCRTRKDAPTFALSDARNDFYGTVDVVVVLKPGRDAVASVRSDFGEDFEGTARKLLHPETGTSATVSAKGSTYTVTGRLRMYEGSSKRGTLVPFTITVECAGTNW